VLHPIPEYRPQTAAELASEQEIDLLLAEQQQRNAERGEVTAASVVIARSILFEDGARVERTVHETPAGRRFVLAGISLLDCSQEVDHDEAEARYARMHRASMTFLRDAPRRASAFGVARPRARGAGRPRARRCSSSSPTSGSDPGPSDPAPAHAENRGAAQRVVASWFRVGEIVVTRESDQR